MHEGTQRKSPNSADRVTPQRPGGPQPHAHRGSTFPVAEQLSADHQLLKGESVTLGVPDFLV